MVRHMNSVIRVKSTLLAEKGPANSGFKDQDLGLTKDQRQMCIAVTYMFSELLQRNRTMKKRTKVTPTTLSAASKPAKKTQEEKPKATETKVLEEDEYENSGFSKWLHTGEGVEFMKYFVILNSFGVFLTLGWPSISKVYYIIRSFFTDDE